MVRAGQHASDSAELRHSGDVPALRGRPVPVQQMQDTTGKP